MTDDTVDQELRRQLVAATSGSSVGAVFTLRSPDLGSFLSPEETTALARKVLDEAAHSSGSSPQAVQVFANLQSFAVQGSSALVNAIIARPEIETAMANEQPGEVLIKPVARRAASRKRQVR